MDQTGDSNAFTTVKAKQKQMLQTMIHDMRMFMNDVTVNQTSHMAARDITTPNSVQ